MPSSINYISYKALQTFQRAMGSLTFKLSLCQATVCALMSCVDPAMWLIGDYLTPHSEVKRVPSVWTRLLLTQNQWVGAYVTPKDCTHNGNPLLESMGVT